MKIYIYWKGTQEIFRLISYAKQLTDNLNHNQPIMDFFNVASQIDYNNKLTFAANKKQIAAFRVFLGFLSNEVK